MTIRLNKPALAQAKHLVSEGEVVRDERDDWSGAAPAAREENAFIDEYGWTAYSHWHLGIDDDESEETKGRFSFPYGDFSKVRRGGVISGESRASQNDYDDIREALGDLMKRIDEG